MSNWQVPAVAPHIVDALRRAMAQAHSSKEWVVVVCPSGSEALTFFNAYAGSLLPAGSSYSGRTALLSGGGRFSVVSSKDDPFVPQGTPFSVMFIGWGDDLAADNSRMQVWRDRAMRVLK